MAEDLRSLLDALLQPNNDLRNAAEVAFREQLAAAPAPLARGLAELGLNGVPAAAGPDLGRQQLAVMLLGKVLVDKAGGSIGVGTGIGVGAVRWPALRGQQPEMQGALLTAMSSHPSPIIRKATCDVAGTFALSLHAELEDPSQTPWPELLAFALGAAGGLSDSVVARESAVRILANIVDVLAALEPQALVRTLEANLNYGLGGGGAGGADLGSICKIHELSVSAFTMLMEYLPDDVPHELFQPLLPLSLTAAAGLATLSALGAPAEGACDALENIAAVAVSSSVMPNQPKGRGAA
uniref:Importin N-terminal domain-containing protein n=1 Tax=Phaeomonas parva TaxID=124430 RepID=A0A7S1XPA7_9STRA|mmetsp:Transcript_22369/g.69113  ORF Transcript_22369/g.69113 Transcript_22369/m.69113 type:complete len:296 (+) Transcript_22369:119-1006(+)